MAKDSNYDKMVLSDALFVEYHKFKNNKEYNKNTILQLFKYFNGNILTNLAQYERTNIDPASNLTNQLAHAKNKNKPLTSLAKETSIKLILCDDRTDFPYVNIISANEKINNCISGFFEIQENRDKAIEHIKSICRDAKKISIYDKYFSSDKNNITLLSSILPKQKLEIKCYSNSRTNRGISQQDIDKLQNSYEQYTIKKEDCENKWHDRFLDIDDRIEIILTSGFDHLGSITGDFAYIIHSINNNRF